VILVLGCLLTVLGKDVLFQLAPAVIVLIFLVPVPGRVRQQVAIPLEGLTARATQACCEILGLPVERSGAVLQINGMDVAIEEACNGLRMVFSLTLVSYAIAFGSPLKNFVRCGMVLASPLLALVCNVIRLVPTVWLYGYFPHSTADRFHDLSGWLMPPLAFLVLLGIVRLLRWALVPVTRFSLAYS
jgi:exosortase